MLRAVYIGIFDPDARARLIISRIDLHISRSRYRFPRAYSIYERDTYLIKFGSKKVALFGKIDENVPKNRE